MGQRNAKEEFLRATSDCKIIAAYVELNSYLEDIGDDNDRGRLKPLYTKKDYDNFLNFLDQEYDNGFGGQNLYGTIYCEDGIWLDRGEYDGSEWWQEHQYPNMKEHFKGSDVLKYDRSMKIKRLNT